MKKTLLKFLVILLLAGAAAYTYLHPYHPLDKHYRYLLMCSSFKRPMLLSGQIFRLMNQTYQNFDISVSVKGVDPEKSALTFEKEWKPFIKKGRLFLRYDKNGRQLSNLLNTVRDIDISKYDYFCKIDDDDWYAPEYLENINYNLNKAKNVISFTYSNAAYRLYENIDTTVIAYNNSNLSGPTMCFSRDMLKLLLAFEKNPALYKYYLPDEPDNLDYAREDRLISHLGISWFASQNRWTDPPLVMIGQQYRSVTRNDNYVDLRKIH